MISIPRLLRINWINRVDKGERKDAMTRRRKFSLFLRVFLRVFAASRSPSNFYQLTSIRDKRSRSGQPMVELQRRNVATLQRCEGNAITGLILALLQRFATECNARAAEAVATCGVAESRLTIISAIVCRIYGYNVNAVLLIPNSRQLRCVLYPMSPQYRSPRRGTRSTVKKCPCGATARDDFTTPSRSLTYSEEPDGTPQNPALRSTSEPASSDTHFPLIVTHVSQNQPRGHVQQVNSPHQIFTDLNAAVSTAHALHSSTAFGQLPFIIQKDPPVISQSRQRHGLFDWPYR
jgi:hypothetical protein